MFNVQSPSPHAIIFFILCCSSSPSSFENVKAKWYPEIQHHAPGVPFILVGTKMDLKEDADTLRKLQEKGLEPISLEQVIIFPLMK